jgi:uncharacterized surface protein with fasciclin (FAS1) repeats
MREGESQAVDDRGPGRALGARRLQHRGSAAARSAPTDAAFAALPPGIERMLLAPENKDQLARVLRYHLVSGRLTAADLEGKISTPVTLEGARLQIDGLGPGIEVEDAKVVQVGIEASNGVMHVIDAVLQPP